jgi:hypothetical protein
MTLNAPVDLDAIHHNIRLEIKDTGDEIDGETEILFAFNADSVKSIPLDFAGLMADAVTENNRAARFQQSGDQLNVANLHEGLVFEISWVAGRTKIPAVRFRVRQSYTLAP